VSAQQHYTISGFIKDAKTGEELIGATVSIKELPRKGENNKNGLSKCKILKFDNKNANSWD
jgi:hypothetical protein